MKFTTPAMRPGLYALAAAVLNGTIGPLNRFGFAAGGSHHQIAFFKCFVAFLLLLVFCLLNADRRAKLASLKAQAPRLLLLSFLGIFCLYFFETWAFSQASIPLVSFLTYAAGAITLVLSAAFLREPVVAAKLLAFASIVAGVYLIMASEAGLSGSGLGIALALLGGLGYAFFLFTSKLFRIEAGLAPLVWLFGFGSLFLAVPFISEGLPLPNPATWLVVIGLVILPTIGGFYCTMKAVHGGDAGSVQIIETSDPLFATAFAFLLFGDRLGMQGWLGAVCIVAGLILTLKKPTRASVLVLQQERG